MKESVTIFPDDPIETDNTDETYLEVSNDDLRIPRHPASDSTRRRPRIPRDSGRLFQ